MDIYKQKLLSKKNYYLGKIYVAIYILVVILLSIYTFVTWKDFSSTKKIVFYALLGLLISGLRTDKAGIRDLFRSYTTYKKEWEKRNDEQA